MKDLQENISFSYSLLGFHDSDNAGRVMYVLCRRGSCSFLYHGQRFTMHRQDLMVTTEGYLSDIIQSDDCMLEIVSLLPQFQRSFRELDYSVRVQMELFLNPVIHLTSDQMMLCRANFQFVNYHLLHTNHLYYESVMHHAVMIMLLDIYDIHAQRHGLTTLSSRYSELIKGFIALLDEGAYRMHHDAGYYADKLFVSAKHLNFVCRHATGFSAAWWISRYLQIDIRERLYQHDLTIKQLTNYYNFSSASYFCRYIEKNLGVSPKELQK